MKRAFLTVLATLLISGPALADEEDTARWRQRAPVYNAYNLDKYENARIVQGGSVDFSAADEDKDGTISRTEMRRYLRDYERAARDDRSRREARMATDYLALKYRDADRNGDGNLTGEERKRYEAEKQAGNGRPAFYYRSSDID